MNTATIIALCVVALPVAWFLGGFVLKLLWSWWPIALTSVAGGWIVYQQGIDTIIVLPVGIVLGIIGAWLWQRTRIYLRLDSLIGRWVFFD